MFENVLDAIGNTPLVRIPTSSGARLYAKLEYLNPGGSIKDRSSLFMIEHAEKTGLLKPGGTLVDASSGNHGIALAMIGAAKGYRVIITVPEKVSQEKKDTLRAFGAEVVVCKPTALMTDPLSYHGQAVTLAQQIPGAFMPNQYYNLNNPLGQFSSLGPEIWRQTEGTITHFFAAAGTGGTATGAGRYLKEQNPAVKVIAMDAATSFRSTGGKPTPYQVEGIGVDSLSPIFANSVIDEFIPVTDDQAFGILKSLARTYGLLAGPSSGAVAFGALEYAKKMGPNDVGVMIFGDSGRAYLTKNIY